MIFKLFNRSVYLFIFISFLLPWFSLFTLGGGFQFRFFHLALIILFFRKTLLKKPTIKFIPKARDFSILISLSFLVFFISILWSSNPSYGLVLFIKNVLYFIFFIFINDFFIDNYDDLKENLIKSAKISLLFFVIFNIVAAIAIKENLFFDLIIGIFSGGNATEISYYYFYRLGNFNIFDFNFLTFGDDNFLKPIFRNVFGIACIIIYAILDIIKKPKKTEKFLKVFLFLLILISLSRSALILFVLFFLIKKLVKSNNKKLLLFIIFTPIILLLTIPFLDSGVLERYTEFSKDARIIMYIDSIKEVSSNIFFGKGFGTLIFSEGVEYHVHNFILAGFYSAGILGLIFPLLVVMELFLLAYNKIKFNLKEYEYYYFYCFPFLVIFRMMIGGNNGLPSFHDWLALSLFFSWGYYLDKKSKVN